MDSDRTQIITLAQSRDLGPSARLHCLEQIAGAEVGRRYLVGDAGLSLGRTPPADLVLADSEVSRLHCRLTLEGDDLRLTDLNSTNGTFVDGVRIKAAHALRSGQILRLGGQSFMYSWLTSDQIRKSDELDRDLAVAFSYVQALLPPPLRDGPIRADWLIQPCAKLGGDAFGYGALNDDKFFVYLFDVSGHGAGAAMHSAAVMNVLRQRALPTTDMSRPDEVLASLNAMFPMQDHAEMYFTIWYGVYDRATRRLDYASAGHHAAYLVAADRRSPAALRTPNPMIGAAPARRFRTDSALVPAGASLYLFSDGVFEIVTPQGVQWGLSDFLPLIVQAPVEGVTEPERLYGAVMGASRSRELDDDFSLVVMTFD